MESPISYLYTMAILGMTFIGFSAIVMLLRQTLGSHLRAFDALPLDCRDRRAARTIGSNILDCSDCISGLRGRDMASSTQPHPRAGVTLICQSATATPPGF